MTVGWVEFCETHRIGILVGLAELDPPYGHLAMRIGTMVILLVVLGFCAIGFVSTFWQEDATLRLVMRALYGTVGLVCLITMVWAVRPPKPEKKDE